MNVLDYVVLGALVLSMVMGFWKGFIKQLLTLVGIVVVALLTATVTPYMQNWLSGIIAAEGTRAAVAMFASVILLSVVYGILARLLGKLLTKLHILKVLDKILGGVMGIVVVYLVFAVIFAVFTGTGEEFLPMLKGLLGENLQTSWFATKIYSSEANFFGNWVINGIAEKLLEGLQPAA